MLEDTTRVSAYVLLIENERLLLCRLSAQSDDPGGWTIPGGGLDFGETPEAGAIRELQEETGLNVEIENLVAITSRALPPNSKRGAMHWIRIFYRGRIIGGTLRPEVEGSTDLPAWFDRGEIQSLPLVELAGEGVRVAFRE